MSTMPSLKDRMIQRVSKLLFDSRCEASHPDYPELMYLLSRPQLAGRAFTQIGPAIGHTAGLARIDFG